MWKLTEITSVVLAVSVIFIAAFPGVHAVYVDVEPKAAVVLPGQSLQVMCKVGVSIQYCRMEIPGQTPVNLNPKLTPENGIQYSGAGLAAGQCGVTIQRITDANNGVLQCTLGIETESKEPVGEMRILVARGPKTPELDVNRGSESIDVYKIGDTLQASCFIRDGRPASNISWYLDDEQIMDGLNEPTVINGIDNLQTVLQNLTRYVRPDDNGRMLRCVADHIALEGRNSQSSIQLNVKYPPQPLSNPIDLFGYELGKAGLIDVEIQANPAPQIQWMVGATQIKQGTVDPSGRFEASISDMGRGRYTATLHVGGIKKEDTETPFKLTAYNDQGSAEYNVVISTSAEPQGLELGVGPLVGIVISILLVLLIIFLIIYARVSGRWCFGEAESSHHNYESSDTESADVEGQKKRRFNNLKSLFKKNKEDPIPEHEGEDAENDYDEPEVVHADGEETEGATPGKGDGALVYAELDLVKTDGTKPVVRKEDEKTEYAEIIYTKNGSPTAKKKDGPV